MAPEPGGFGQRILDLADELAALSEASDHLTCTYFSPAHRATAARLQDWMRSAGLVTHIDVVGNVIGKYPSADPHAKTLIVGSHYDTVRNAGRYDGRLGILTALVLLEELGRRGQRLPFHVELIAFSEEEGVRFGVPYLGSSAVAGRFDPCVLERQDASGLTVADVIRAAGGDPANIAALARRPQDLLGYLEVHIEQGPVLLDMECPLGIVTAIAGSSRYAIEISGSAGHAGTVPMGARRDAATAAAELLLFAEQRCRAQPGLVGTVGQIAIPNSAINVIPGRCELSLDIRAEREDILAAAIADVFRCMRQIESSRGVTITATEIQRTPVVACARRPQTVLADGLRASGVAVHHLPSGAGHDAVMFDGLTDVGMLFVRCGNGGVSHSPRESVTAADADMAARVLMNALMNLPQAH